MSRKKATEAGKVNELDLDRLKLFIGFAVFVIGVILVIFAIVTIVIAPFALPGSVLMGIIGMVTSVAGALTGGKAMKRLSTGGKSK